MSESNRNLVLCPKWVLTPRLIGLLIVDPIFFDFDSRILVSLCGAEFEYLHRSSPASRRRPEKETQCRGLLLVHPVPGDINAGLGPRGWSCLESETVKYDQEYLGTRTKTGSMVKDRSNHKTQTCPLVREGSAHQQARSSLTVTKIGSWDRDEAWNQNRLVDWPSIVT
jgi:hypothetical protein